MQYWIEINIDPLFTRLTDSEMRNVRRRVADLEEELAEKKAQVDRLQG